MAFEELIQPVLSFIGFLFIPLVGIYWVSASGIQTKIKLFLILLGMFIISAMALGGHYDLFDNPPWTVQFSLIIFMLYFLEIRFPSSFQPLTIGGIIVLYFLLLPVAPFWANLLSGTLYYLFWVGFLLSMVDVTINWIRQPST
jgi:hypothetical protein